MHKRDNEHTNALFFKIRKTFKAKAALPTRDQGRYMISTEQLFSRRKKREELLERIVVKKENMAVQRVSRDDAQNRHKRINIFCLFSHYTQCKNYIYIYMKTHTGTRTHTQVL